MNRMTLSSLIILFILINKNINSGNNKNFRTENIDPIILK